MSQFLAYVAGRAHHRPTGPEGAVPVAQENSSLPRSPRLPMVDDSHEGVGRLDLPEEAFQRGTPFGAASPHVPGPVDDATSRASGLPPVLVPLALTCACFPTNLGTFNSRPYTLTDSGDSFGGPPLTTSRGRWGTHKAFPDAGDSD